MTAVLTPRPLRLFGEADADRTLDDVVCEAWERIAAQSSAGCPVCDGVLRPELGEQSAAGADSANPRLRGRCTGCGSTLS